MSVRLHVLHRNWLFGSSLTNKWWHGSLLLPNCTISSYRSILFALAIFHIHHFPESSRWRWLTESQSTRMHLMFGQRFACNSFNFRLFSIYFFPSKVMRNEGVFALWKGFTPYYMRLGPHTVLTFIFLEQMNAAYFKFVLGIEAKGALWILTITAFHSSL